VAARDAGVLELEVGLGAAPQDPGALAQVHLTPLAGAGELDQEALAEAELDGLAAGDQDAPGLLLAHGSPRASARRVRDQRSAAWRGFRPGADSRVTSRSLAPPRRASRGTSSWITYSGPWAKL